jgi:hypothetical protein
MSAPRSSVVTTTTRTAISILASEGIGESERRAACSERESLLAARCSPQTD